jgi:hypothetical protein
LLDTIDIGPLAFWRENQGRFPAIAALARDVLSVPATGAGVERLFNTARDICHYRRGRMKSETIQELMMFLCTSRFDLEEKESQRLEKFFSREEIEAAKEEKDERLDEVEVEPISDTEEPNEKLNDGRAVDDTISALFFHIVNRHRQLRSLPISYRQSTSTVSQTVDTISANEIIVGDISSPVIGK